MATSKDWQVMQSSTLYKLKRLVKKNKNGPIPVDEVEEIIGEIQASMTEDEIAQVDKQVDMFVK